MIAFPDGKVQADSNNRGGEWETWQMELSSSSCGGQSTCTTIAFKSHHGTYLSCGGDGDEIGSSHHIRVVEKNSDQTQHSWQQWMLVDNPDPTISVEPETSRDETSNDSSWGYLRSLRGKGKKSGGRLWNAASAMRWIGTDTAESSEKLLKTASCIGGYRHRLLAQK